MSLHIRSFPKVGHRTAPRTCAATPAEHSTMVVQGRACTVGLRPMHIRGHAYSAPPRSPHHLSRQRISGIVAEQLLVVILGEKVLRQQVLGEPVDAYRARRACRQHYEPLQQRDLVALRYARYSGGKERAAETHRVGAAEDWVGAKEHQHAQHHRDAARRPVPE
eukprot:CAMPEP_0117497296 /NCGR_PEP_ID=MMETSP0784-20121206/21109_1 /TAXON_ID=39447 /ORGANISM="" /LENGTH=163 /DNA_ID=CAMNT_0005292313 /DNA_START=47 /DNA_END=539 /DNA_ORIENTATION=-